MKLQFIIKNFQMVEDNFQLDLTQKNFQRNYQNIMKQQSLQLLNLIMLILLQIQQNFSSIYLKIQNKLQSFSLMMKQLQNTLKIQNINCIIDKQQIVKARLYREHTLPKDNVYIKDLSILGRNLNKVIIVDNMPENFQLQPENGIYIQSWTGEQKDRALKDLMPLLEQIAIKKCKDVREALNQFREQMIQKVQQGIKNPYENLQLT